MVCRARLFLVEDSQVAAVHIWFWHLSTCIPCMPDTDICHWPISFLFGLASDTELDGLVSANQVGES